MIGDPTINGLTFTDNLPAGLVVAPNPNVMNSCMGGTITAVAGSGVISYTGGMIPFNTTCTIGVDVISNTPNVLHEY